MRGYLSKEKLHKILQALADACEGPGSIYLCGGATAVDLGFRAQTIDLDLKLDPEPPGVFSAIGKIKDQFRINVELASPDDFIPALPNWRERSIYIGTVNHVNFFHYDPLSQILAKIERGHQQDVDDAKRLVHAYGISGDMVMKGFDSIRKELIRYPAIDGDGFAERIRRFLEGLT